MRLNQRNLFHLYPILWILILGLTNADGQPENTENFEISTEMDLNEETKTDITDLEIMSDKSALNSIAYDSDYQSFEGWNGEEYEYESLEIQDMSSEEVTKVKQSDIDFNGSKTNGTISKATKRIHNKASRPIYPLQDYAYDTKAFEETVEETIEEFEVSTIVMFALGVTILFIAGTKFIIGAGYCSSRSPSIPEIRSSMGLSLSEPGPEGVVHENQPLVDDVFPDDPIQNQNNAGAIQQV